MSGAKANGGAKKVAEFRLYREEDGTYVVRGSSRDRYTPELIVTGKSAASALRKAGKEYDEAPPEQHTRPYCADCYGIGQTPKGETCQRCHGKGILAD